MAVIGSPHLSMPVTSSALCCNKKSQQTGNSSCCAQIKPEMSVPAAWTENLYVILHNLGMFGYL